MAVRIGGRRKCYLCDLPHSPWAVLTDFTELVCRGCCNYEGADRVEEVIQAARKMRSAHSQEAAARNAVEVNSAVDDRRRLRHGGSVSNGVGVSGGAEYLPDHSMLQINGVQDTLYKRRFIPASGDEIVKSAVGRLPSSPSAAAAASRLNPQYTVSSAQVTVRDTLAGLNKCVPFNVRFAKDPSLLGRVFAFDALVRGNGESEIKIYMEYPPGSGVIYSSASATGRQMAVDYKEKMGLTASTRHSATSSGYKDLEYERTLDNWRLLSNLLPEAARYFRAPIAAELMPASNLDPRYPYLPSPFVRSGRRRRTRSGGEAGDSSAAKRCGSGESTRESPPLGRANGPPAPASPCSVGDSVRSSSILHPSPTQSPDVRENSSGSNGAVPSPGSLPNLMAYGSRGMMHQVVGKSFSVASSLFCLTCRCALQDTRFVQCPSVLLHKFCFSCSRDAIRNAKRECTDVFCPSGQRCPVVGNTTPWAFMNAEIETILAAEPFKREK
eukprot:m.110129 g.110129  ORF g.110129 m.110129 type:complete len:497 (+) comp37386_c0_seq14:2264-3754(+)